MNEELLVTDKNGIQAFLDRYSPNARELRPLFPSNRLRRILDGERLCSTGDEANCFWIIERGRLRIEAPAWIVERQAGEIVGEQAFFRMGDRAGRRGATIRASGDAEVFEIDRSFIDRLQVEHRAIWMETCARALSAKLDAATAQRQSLRAERINTEMTWRRFVPLDGEYAARAAFAQGDFSRRIEVEECEAVVWFSDVAGFSDYVKGTDRAEAARVIRAVMDIQSSVVHAHDGQVDKFMGDGMMAYWKAPDVQRKERAACMAVTAAVSCVRKLRAFFTENSIPCDIRIGLHVGSVIFGDFGGSDRIAFTMIGDTVNAASRYEQARTCSQNRPLGRVRVSEQIFDLLTDKQTIELFESETRTFTVKHGAVFRTRVANV